MVERPTSTFKIQEKFHPRTREALMSLYPDAQRAFLELIDNAVDDRIENSPDPLLIRIRASRHEFYVYNRGGQGLDDQGLQNYFTWGLSEKTGPRIGHYGVGGKGAMGSLGRSLEVICSPKGSDKEYRVVDPDWESRTELGDYDGEIRKASSPDGYFRARVTNVKREIIPKILIAKLSDIYRPILLDGSVIMSVNGIPVAPLEIRYLEKDSNFESKTKRIQTRFGDWIEIKVGILEEGQRVKPGIRCYYRGRLIEDEHFFGHPNPSQMPQAARLIGEAHLDFVPVTANKSNFIHSSPQWEHASRMIDKALIEWYEKLASLKMEGTTNIESYEKEIAKSVKRMLEHVLATSGLITKAMLPGESSGRLPPTRRDIARVKTGRTSTSKGPQEGQTAPLIEATIGTMKRWGPMHEIEIVPMGKEGRRSELFDEKGRQVVKINSDHPLYQAEKAVGGEALTLYQAETVILKVAERVSAGKSIDDYVELVNSMSSDFGAFYNARMKYKLARRSKAPKKS